MVEDEAFNKVGRKPKVYREGEAPVQDGPPSSNEIILGASVPSAPQAYHQMAASHTGGCSPKAGQFVDEVLDLNSKMITWKLKLEFVNNLMYKYKDEIQEFPTFRTEGLAILSAFLYFINTGHIKCGDQGHNRPCHQAGFAYSMFKVLDSELVVVNNQYEENGDLKLNQAALSNCHIVRLLKTQLPSFAD